MIIIGQLLSPPMRLCNTRRLSVSKLHEKLYWSDFHDKFIWMYLRTRTFPFNFEIYPDPDITNPYPNMDRIWTETVFALAFHCSRLTCVWTSCRASFAWNLGFFTFCLLNVIKLKTNHVLFGSCLFVSWFVCQQLHVKKDRVWLWRRNHIDTFWKSAAPDTMIWYDMTWYQDPKIAKHSTSPHCLFTTANGHNPLPQSRA